MEIESIARATKAVEPSAFQHSSKLLLSWLGLLVSVSTDTPEIRAIPRGKNHDARYRSENLTIKEASRIAEVSIACTHAKAVVERV